MALDYTPPSNARTNTTPMVDNHIADHNATADALTEIKSEVNAHLDTVTPWLAVDGINTPWAFEYGDLLYVSGTAQFDSSTTTITTGTDVTWTPTAAGVGGGTVAAVCNGKYTYIPAASGNSGLFHISLQLIATGAWSGVTELKVPLPTGFKQSSMEQMLPGYCRHVTPLFGIRYPIIGTIHSKVTGGAAAGVDNDPPVITFSAQTK